MAKKTDTGKKKASTRILVWVIALIIILIPIVYVWRLLKKPNFDNSMDEDIIINDDITNEHSDGYQNFVIFGVDSRNNALLADTRSDTIILVRINNETKDVKLCSIYRDTYVNIPKHGYTKINHAYALGGYSLALSTINTNFDLDFNQYVTVNFMAVTKVIDLLGGITLDITEDELKWLNGYIREINRVNNTDVSGLTSSGTQTVNGTQALAYARIRYTAGGDFKRTERQRIVIDKLFEKAKTASVSTIFSIVNQMLPEISTNINTSEILQLAQDILSYQISDTTGFPFEKQIGRYNKVSYVYPVDLLTNVTELHAYLYEDTNYIPSNVVAAISDYIKTVPFQ